MQFAEIGNSISAGVRAVVSQWANNTKLQELLPVHQKIKDILLRAPPQYHLGTLRPDVLLGDDGSLQVCEINARFPMNGYLISAFANEAIHEYSMKPSSSLAQQSMSPISSLRCFIPDLRARLVKDDVDTVWLIRANESTHDTSMLPAALGVNMRHCSPANLACLPNCEGLFYKDTDGHHVQIKSCVLELEQDEYLELSDDVLNALAQMSFEGKALNDFRTIFLAHDKKMLAILRSDMYEIDEHNRQLLKKYIVPTIIPKTATLHYEGLEGASLVLKPSLLGKGIGIVMQKNMSEEDFLNELRQNLPRADYVIQKYIKQRKVEIMRVDGEIELLNTVGIVSTFDGKFYGPGVFRSNNEDTISMSYGGIASFPVLPTYKIPAGSRSACSTLDTVDTRQVLRSLEKEGVALISVDKCLEDKSTLLRFLKEGLGADCRTHSDVCGEVWDIRPAKNWTLSHARSHTTRPFEIHTDASFEAAPPEFVAMSVLHADRNGGGLFSLCKISEVVDQMSAEEVGTLMKVKPRWVVPPEFFRAESGDTFAPVLISRDRARFRRDKLGVDHLSMSDAQNFQSAFQKFCNLLEKNMSKGFLVPQGTLIIVDNQKFAHARTEVTDMDRHLHRVRFDLPMLRKKRC